MCYYNISFLFFSDADSSDDADNGMISEEIEDNKRQIKKRKLVDDTDQPIYPCEDCTQCFTTLVDLKVHARTHPKDSRHICKVCNQGFASASTLCRHMKVNLYSFS